MRSGAHSAVWAGASPGAELLPARTAPCGPGAGHRTLQHAVRRARCRFGGARPGRRTPTGAHGTVSSGIRARDRSACGPARGTVPFGRGAARVPNTRLPAAARRARRRAVWEPGPEPRSMRSGAHGAVWAGRGPGAEHLPARTVPCSPEAGHGTALRAVRPARCRLGGGRPWRRAPAGADGTVRAGSPARDRAACSLACTCSLGGAWPVQCRLGTAQTKYECIFQDLSPSFNNIDVFFLK